MHFQYYSSYSPSSARTLPSPYYAGPGPSVFRLFDFRVVQYASAPLIVYRFQFRPERLTLMPYLQSLPHTSELESYFKPSPFAFYFPRAATSPLMILTADDFS